MGRHWEPGMNAEHLVDVGWVSPLSGCPLRGHLLTGQVYQSGVNIHVVII